MKTENAIFTSVIIKPDEVIVATDFDYETAKETMVQMLEKSFDVQGDDGLIYKCEGPGVAEPIFNFRAYLNQEEDGYNPPVKENSHAKLFFECPSCQHNEGKPDTDDDGDIIVRCKSCKTNVPLL